MIPIFSSSDELEKRIVRIPFSGCWIWMASCITSGYGDFRRSGKHYLAHRASYEHFHGAFPPYLHVLHKCDVRSCVNPDHLFVGTNQDNIKDSVAKGRRKGVTRDRPSGLVYCWSQEAKKRWLKMRKLSPAIRAEIRMRYQQEKTSQRKLASEYMVTSTMIHNIIHEVASF